MDHVISADRLHAMLKKGALLLVDTRPFASYSEAHIPGAVNIDLMQFHWIDTSPAGIREFNRQMRIVLSNVGVSERKLVVFYDDVSGPSAARGVWLLLYFSHRKVAMLDGGFNEWKARGFGVETTSHGYVHSSFRGIVNPKLLADFGRLRTAAKSAKTVIIDARSPEEFDGSVMRAARGGHIPASVNIDWNSNLHRNKFKARGDLRRMYGRLPKNAEIITYCQGGYRAANTFVALKMLGYKNVSMYLGSWGEWGNRLDLPVSHR